MSKIYTNETRISEDILEGNLAKREICFCQKSMNCDVDKIRQYNLLESIDVINDVTEVFVSALFLTFVLILRLCSSKHIWRRKDISLKYFQLLIPPKYWGHNFRSIIVLINSFFWCLYIGEVLIRWTYSQQKNLSLLVLLAPFTSLTSIIFSLVLYERLESLAAHQLYLVSSSFLWGLQTLNNGARLYRVVYVYCVHINRVAPSLYVINGLLASCLLIIDSATIILWVVMDRHAQTVDLNPKRGEGHSKRDPKLNRRRGVAPTPSCVKERRQPSPAPSSENSVVFIPTGKLLSDELEEEEEEVGGRERTFFKDEVSSKLRYEHNEASFLSKCTFGWYVKLLRKGWKRPLEFTDLDIIPEKESSKYQYEKFQKSYGKVADTSSGEVSLWNAFLLSYWRPFLFSGILKLLGDTVNVVGPLAISPIVAFVRNIQEGTWELHGDLKNKMYFVGWREMLRNGWVLAVVAVVCSLLQSTFSQASTHLLATAGIHVKSALQAMVYDKSLKMSVSASKRRLKKLKKDGKVTMVGSQSLEASRVINLTWDDTQNIMSFFMHCHYLWAIPFKMCGLVVLLWLQIGYSAVCATLIAVFLLIPLQFLLGKCIAAANTRIVEATDKRLSMTHEVMTLIRTVKTLALEGLFVRRVTEARKEELRYLLTDSLLRALMASLTQASGILIILLAFGLYYSMQDEPPDEGIIFSSLALFNQLTVPLFILPLIVAYSIKAKRSTSRLQEFFAESEVSPRRCAASDEEITTNSGKGDPRQVLMVENAEFSYDDAWKYVLTGITTSIPRGKLTVVLGGVGSGKTSFLLSLLGELNMTSGTLEWERSSSVAFVSQTPWLLNCTLRENILMGKTLQNRKYKRILGVCALQPDIDILPYGDDTEIGEKGINLSGGQRQRVALARALYSDLPVIMMDCPFSALDATVAQQVSRRVREEHLRKGLSSTLVIATQHNTLAVFADKVIYLEDKTIKCQGSPEEVSHCHPDLWSEWISSFSSFASVEQILKAEGRERICLWKERNYLYRHLTRISRITRKGRRGIALADEDFNDPLLRSPLRRHLSLLRTSPLQILLPSNEMDSLPSVLFGERKSRPPKSSVFRTISSSPTFGRTFGGNASLPLDRRFAKSLPPRPTRSRTCSRETDDDDYKLRRENSVLRKLFSSPSSSSAKSKGAQPRSSKGRWNSRILSFLSWRDVGGSGVDSIEGEEEEEGGESDDSRVYEALFDKEERKRGRISKWNYVAYLKACGWPAGTLFLLFLFLNQGLLISLDVWLGHWSKMCTEGNCDHTAVNCTKDEVSSANFSSFVRSHDKTFLQGNGTVCKERSLEVSSYLLMFGLLSGLAVFSGLLTICLAQLAAHRGRRILHEKMLKAVVGTRGKFFDLNPIGRILDRFTSDISLLDKELGWSLMHFLYFALLCSSAILVNVVISPIFFVVTVPICLVYYVLQHVFRCSSRELKRLESLSRSPVLGLITETADFPCVVRAYGTQGRFFSCYFRRLDSYLESYVLLHAGNRWLGISLDYMGSVIVFLSTVACLIGSTTGAGYLLSPLTVGLAIKYTLAIPVYLNWLVRFLSDTEICLNAVERIRQYGELTPEVNFELDDDTKTANKVVCCGQKKCICRDTLRQVGKIPIMRAVQTGNGAHGNTKNSSSDYLVFENVNLFYEKNSDAVLSQVSFKILSGQKVGICGRTGSGKSSLFMGIVRMAEYQEGRILIDSVDVRSIELSVLRKGISVMTQEVNIFKDSVRFNMDPENKYSDEALWNALELIKLKDFVEDLPQKLETQLLGSLILSAGQRQLLVLSRILLEKRPLVLLDEFTSNLDSQMERHLLTMLQQELPYSTIIFVTHSIMSLMTCDRVLSIDEGRLVEDGPPSELSQRSNGVFVSLLRSAGHEGAAEGYSMDWLSPPPSFRGTRFKDPNPDSL